MSLPHPNATRFSRITGWLNTLLVLGLFSLGLPVRMTEPPQAAVLEDRHGNLLGARIAADGQWRFPPVEGYPERVATAVLVFEDRWYRYHPGINPVSLLRAIRVNLRAGRVLQGGSTLPMQVMRLLRGSRPRVLREKLLEAHGALRLQGQFGKEAVLDHFLQRAPFGGNVVGLDAACWRYFGKSPHALSWGEAAGLAVLPNSPALIHPGRNPEALLQKRDRLLQRLHALGHLDEDDLALALDEPLPAAPQALPRLAPELLATLRPTGGGLFCTTLDGVLQGRVRAVMTHHHPRLAGNGIRNMAVLLLDNRTNEVLAYAGNTPDGLGGDGGDVDIIRARRSPGSTLKPLLYAWALQDGQIWPQSLIEDIPTQYGSYRPENFHRDYRGMVPAQVAIASSLNVPMVRLLREYGPDRFLKRLQALGFRSLDQPAEHYGLSLVLGGGEVSLWELTNAYGALARHLQATEDTPSTVAAESRLLSTGGTGRTISSAPGKGAIWAMMEAMSLPDRPEEAGNWDFFASSRKVAWKTGTSFGFRDAWSVAVTPEYTLGVWVGNADGEARADLTGIKAAAPLLFDILALLPPTGWFEAPLNDLEYREACARSGYPAGNGCPVERTLVPLSNPFSATCRYHQRLTLHPESGLRTDGNCLPPALAVQDVRFVLPPVESHYYALRHPDYLPLPDWHPGCGLGGEEEAPIRMIHPTPQTRLTAATGLSGTPQPIVFLAAHREADRTLHWHLDGQYLGQTSGRHQWAMKPETGAHVLTLTDDLGRSLRFPFRVGN